MVHQSNSGDHQIIGAYRRPLHGQIGANASIGVGGSIVERQARELLEQGSEQSQIVFSPSASVGTVEQLRFYHSTEGNVRGLARSKLGFNR